MDINSFPRGFIPYSQNNTLIANNTGGKNFDVSQNTPIKRDISNNESSKALDEINSYVENKSLGSIVGEFFSDIFKPFSISGSNDNEYARMLDDYASRYANNANTSSNLAQSAGDTLKNLAEGE